MKKSDEFQNFDDKIKARAAQAGEDVPLPEGFEERMNALLRTLPEVSAPTCRRFPLNRAASVALAATLTLSAVAAAATPVVLTLARGSISYFSEKQDSVYVEKLQDLQEYNAVVGVSDTKDGRTLTIDNIALDDSYIYLFYTMTKDTPMRNSPNTTESQTAEDTNLAEKTVSSRERVLPEDWQAQGMAPFFHFQLNGEEMHRHSYSLQTEAQFKDDYTLTGMTMCPVEGTLPDTFDLSVSANSISDASQGLEEFHFELSIDKSAISINSQIIEPKADWHMYYDTTQLQTDESNPEEENYIPKCFAHDVRIERIAISPLSATITIGEGGDDMPLMSSDFVVRDEQGNYLPLDSTGTFSGPGYNQNMYDIIGLTKDTKTLTLIPVLGYYRPPRLMKCTPEDIPFSDGSETGLILESLDIGERQTVAVFSLQGPGSYLGNFYLLDENGEKLELTGDYYMDISRSHKTGKITYTATYEQASPEEVARIKGCAFYQPVSPLLLEDQAITIDLA